jgi:hypothetical protein
LEAAGIAENPGPFSNEKFITCPGTSTLLGSRMAKRQTREMFVIYLNFIETTNEDTRNINALKTNLENNIF